MKKLAIAILAVAIAGTAQAKGSHGGHFGARASSGHASTSVHWTAGHTTKNGTYVQGHYSTDPNTTRNDNFSTRGNTNPYTGEAGTKPRDEDPK